MTRYALAIELYDVTTEVSANGSPQVVEGEHTTVFANRFNIGSDTWAAGRSLGLKGECEIQVRSYDYGGQQRALVNDVEYEVEDTSDTGEFTRLMLRRRLNNG